VTGGWSSPAPADRYILQSAEVLQPETIQNISLELFKHLVFIASAETNLFQFATSKDMAE
jgi:hypothetical protein